MSGPLMFDRVLETTTTVDGSPSGGPITLAGAVAGYQSFAIVGNGNQAPYAIWAVDGNGTPSGAWEVGIGTYTASGTSLARTTPLYSSAGNGTYVNFGAGTKRVGCVLPAIFAFRSSQVSRGHIQGLQLSYISTTAIAVASGELAVNDKVLTYAGATLTSGSTMKNILNVTVTLQASRSYFVFMGDVAGVATVGIEESNASGSPGAWGPDGATPVFDTTYDYWKAASTGVAWRRIGKFWTGAAGVILYFLMSGKGRARKVTVAEGALVLQNAGASTTYAAVTAFAPYYTTDDDEAQVIMRPSISAGTSVNVYATFATDGGTLLAVNTGSWCQSGGADNYGSPHSFPHAGTLHYKVSGTSAQLRAEGVGFTFTV